MGPCSPWDCHSIPTLALQYFSASSLGFCSCAQGAPERSSAPLPHVPASSSPRFRRELRRVDGEGSAGWAGWHRARWARTAGHCGDGVSRLLAALCSGKRSGGPVGGCGGGGCCGGEQGAQLTLHPRAGSWAAPSTALWGDHPSPPLEGCCLPYSWAARARRSEGVRYIQEEGGSRLSWLIVGPQGTSAQSASTTLPATRQSQGCLRVPSSGSG